jgi:alkanesulfonate monooxygenase SsuD/methylene tetrahydromethanopterin reductase-like flavin-dependent oxidoreductase (luciferase family)
MDYGHPLTFGVHLSDPTRQAIETAALAERLGLNYLSIGSGSIDGSEIGEDAHLEHWTLASQLAARTGSITLRTAPQSGVNPVVIARSAASLDLLSGARTPNRYQRKPQNNHTKITTALT